ncbi:bifunctional DNA primase/polymerase [Reyranella sp.]|uniref:bifunctional DNA primase/polymerase n=1 Tax=Reyranella sp. TaxID=1929291 RepID=UPI0027306998|nr:bifunctional DNA primase/polymerase [Reyranella sp.]MDP2374266.1 bifunctional DNA primase/polymerase [Reyranella sp.]
MALGYAHRGWHVFPIAAGQKQPPLVQWSTEATTDEVIIRRWWSKWPDANIGIACGPSGLCVIDLDWKGTSYHAPGELHCLIPRGEQLPATLTANSASGGEHIYFHGSTRCGKLSRSIDIKSVGGYVVAPGSQVGAGTYEWQNKLEVAALPKWLEGLIGAPPRKAKKKEVEPPAGLDNDADIERARQMLRETEAKPLGSGSDNQAYLIACQLRDLGIGREVACDLMNSEWPHPHDPEWVDRKVRNAFEYATGDAGSESVVGDFPDVVARPRPKTRKSRFLTLDELLELPPPQWLVRGLVPLESVGVLYGPSGSLKSFLAFHLAACCTTGQDAFAGRPCKDADSFYIAAEGGHGFKLRAGAWIKHHGVKPERLHLLPGSVFLDREGEAEKLAEEINGRSLSDDRKLIVVDTLSANFTGKENTDDVAGFLRRCSMLAKKCKATVLIVHHTGKDGAKEERGHYSIRANADFSIRMDRTRTGAKVEVQKLKDADAGSALHLRAVPIEVAPGQEFSSSLVLVEEPAAVRDFNEIEGRGAEMIEILLVHDGSTLKTAAEAFAKRFEVHVNTARKWIKDMRDDRISLEQVEPGNPHGGLIVRVRP